VRRQFFVLSENNAILEQKQGGRMKTKPELIEAILLVYIKSEIKNVIIHHEEHIKTDFENCKEYQVFNKTLKEKDILAYHSTSNVYEAFSQSMHEFGWPEIRFIFLQYKLEGDTYLKLKLRPIAVDESLSPQWQVYGRNIPFFTFTAGTNKDDFIETFEKQLIEFLK
jgi:replication fork clamp-binding protein CrfC